MPKKKFYLHWSSIIIVLINPIVFKAMKQPDRKISLKGKRTISRELSFKQQRSGSQSSNPNNVNEQLQETDSWIKTIVDRLLGPIRFF